jgi:hypothetical protein
VVLVGLPAHQEAAELVVAAGLAKRDGVGMLGQGNAGTEIIVNAQLVTWPLTGCRKKIG